VKTLRVTLLIVLCASCGAIGIHEPAIDDVRAIRSAAYDEFAGGDGWTATPSHAGIGWQLVTIRIGPDGRWLIGPNPEYDERDGYSDYPQAVALVGWSF